MDGAGEHFAPISIYHQIERRSPSPMLLATDVSVSQQFSVDLAHRTPRCRGGAILVRQRWAYWVRWRWPTMRRIVLLGLLGLGLLTGPSAAIAQPAKKASAPAD